jgi:nucleotidyltransferase/DNA polymerase involved in DNA repair
MAEKKTSPIVVVHRGHRLVLTASGVARVAPAPTMGTYLAAKRSRQSR